MKKLEVTTFLILSNQDKETKMTELTTTHQQELQLRSNSLPSDFNKGKLFNAVNSAEPLADALDQHITISGMLFGKGNIADPETGELKNMESVTLLCEEGAYISFSPTILSSAQRIQEVWGVSFEPTVFKVASRKSSNKRTFYILEYVEEQG